jgi:hypothetical protein
MLLGSFFFPSQASSLSRVPDVITRTQTHKHDLVTTFTIAAFASLYYRATSPWYAAWMSAVIAKAPTCHPQPVCRWAWCLSRVPPYTADSMPNMTQTLTHNLTHSHTYLHLLTHIHTHTHIYKHLHTLQVGLVFVPSPAIHCRHEQTRADKSRQEQTRADRQTACQKPWLKPAYSPPAPMTTSTVSCLLLSALVCSCLLLSALVRSCLLLSALVCSCLLLSALVCSCLLSAHPRP